MHLIPVSSRAIMAVGYNPTTKQMQIKFKQGHVYTYCHVPESVFDGLLLSASKGRYYDIHIKDKYHC